MSTNLKKRNKEFGRSTLSHVDILPTICEFMNFSVPDETRFELDGISFFGKTDIYDLQALPYDNKAVLTWKFDGTKSPASVYISPTNNKATGQKDVWTKVGDVAADACTYTIDLTKYGDSNFYKFAVRAANNCLTKQLHK